MADVGKVNELKVLRVVQIGAYLDGGELGDILLPKRYVPAVCNVDDCLPVFVMLDSEDRLIATTDRPLAMVDEFACLRVVAVNAVGAFLDWGLAKDLFVPFREQRTKMRTGEQVVVRIYLDRISGRLVASSKLDKFLDKDKASFEPNEEVDLLVVQKTDLGYKAIVNESHWGMLFSSDVFEALSSGKRLKGFIKQVRPDGKIDLLLHKPGYEKVTGLNDKILQYLEEQNGFMAVTDKSPPELIYSLFGVSKKTYKKSIGALYKKRLIEFKNGGTALIGS